MDFSNLLNPETETNPSPADTLPTVQQGNSDETQHKLSPQSLRSNEGPLTFSTSTQQEAAHALASLSQSPQPPPAQWNGYSAPDANTVEWQRPWDRRQSGFGDPIQLPPPPGAADTRKMSSPTLDQYHVSSRSPEQRRQSAVPSPPMAFTLPPIQSLGQPSTDFAGQISKASNHEVNAQLRSPPTSSHADGAIASARAEIQAQEEVAPSVATQVAPTTSPPHRNPQSTIMDNPVDEPAPSPAPIKQEVAPSPQLSSQPDARRASDVDQKAVKALKSEHSLTKQSPLRESSVPVPSTEDLAAEQEVTTSKKRPAPSKKKGTASAVKNKTSRAPPSKKRKTEPKKAEKSGTPSTAKGTSTKGTPINSSPAPSNRSYSGEPNEEQDEDEDEEMDSAREEDSDVYCICRKPDSGTFMIGCDGPCEDWFHGKCVNIPERDKNLIDKYICPNCTGKHGQTTWKRICRRGGCRNAARVGKTKTGGASSKYCSDECGVSYFREMVTMSRGAQDTAKNRASRRKPSSVSSDLGAGEDDLGARGGALSAGEVKALLDVSKTVEDFRKLGDGVLSPPATPGGDTGDDVAESEAQALKHIETQKEEARHRHGLLKDRMKFITLAKVAAGRMATERDLKPKEYCGYDSRLEWTNEEFQSWRESEDGKQAFELDTLKDEDRMETDDGTFLICDRKKCARHHDWSKLATDSIRSEMQDNGDAMRALEKQEQNIKEKVALRSKAGNMRSEGTVEVHGLGIAAENISPQKDIPTDKPGAVDAVT